VRRHRREDRRWKYILVRNYQYPNNIVEQGHLAIRRQIRPMPACKSYRATAVTLLGIELAHRIRKRQFRLGSGWRTCRWLKKPIGSGPNVNSVYLAHCQSSQDPLMHHNHNSSAQIDLM